MTVEELQQLILDAVRTGNVIGFLFVDEKSITILFKDRISQAAFLQVLDQKRCSYSVFGLSILIRLN